VITGAGCREGDACEAEDNDGQRCDERVAERGRQSSQCRRARWQVVRAAEMATRHHSLMPQLRH
jgi:hypothetical protein